MHYVEQNETSRPDKSRIKERERKNGAPKSHVLTSGSLVANPKSSPDYSVFIIKLYIYFFYFTYPLRCLRVPLGVRVPQVETTALDHTQLDTHTLTHTL
jgi:hypothetical protein